LFLSPLRLADSFLSAGLRDLMVIWKSE